MKNIVASLVLALVVTPTFAASEVASGDTSDSSLGLSKYYLGVGGGEASANTAAFSNGVKSTAFSVLGGYTINDILAAELSYHNFGSMDALHDDSKVIKSTAYGLAVVGFLSPNPNFSFFGKLGYASTNYVIENTGVAGQNNSSGNIYYGFGAKLRLTKHISFNLGMDFYKLVDSGSNAIYSLRESTYGLQYKF